MSPGVTFCLLCKSLMDNAGTLCSNQKCINHQTNVDRNKNRPATQKQVDYIASLVEQLGEDIDIETSGMTAKQASDTIDTLLAKIEGIVDDDDS